MRGTGMPHNKLPVSVGSVPPRRGICGGHAAERAAANPLGWHQRTAQQTAGLWREPPRRGLCVGHASALGGGSGESRAAGIGARHNKLPVSVEGPAASSSFSILS